MRRAADMQRSSDRQSALELQEFLLSAVATAAHLSPPIVIPLKMHYKSYLKRPNAPTPSTRADNLCDGLRELMLVLKRLAPDGRILLSGLAYLLSQSAAAGKHLPPQWVQLDKDQSTDTRNNACYYLWLSAKGARFSQFRSFTTLCQIHRTYFTDTYTNQNRPFHLTLEVKNCCYKNIH